jgi:antitoxin FitA
MSYAWMHAQSMFSMIQIRNVPVSMHRELKARAARAGMSLSDYLLKVIGEAADRPEPAELMRRVRELPPVYPTESAADAVRAERDAR